MTRLIRAEALRLASTRTYWLPGGRAIALIAGAVALTAAATSFTGGTSPARQSWPSPGWPRPSHRSPGRSRSPASSGTRPSLPPS